MPADDSVRAVNKNVPLAAGWLIFGVFRLIVAIWMLSFAGTATVMFGTLLNRVPNPYSLMGVFHIVYSCWMILSAASGVFALLTGITLMSGAGVSRLVALTAAFLSVPFLPVGTMLGTYTMVLFLRRE
jgi:hypothetical protein